MFKLIATRTAPLTRELAHEFATMPESKQERPLRADRLAFLDSRLRAGHFYSPKWAVAWLEGKKCRVNGQHSSAMLDRLEPPDFPVGLMAVIDEFHCESQMDVAELFAQFDNAVSTRSTRDLINAHKTIHDELASLASSTVSRAVNGISAAMTDCEKRMNPEERAHLVHTCADFILWVRPFLRARSLDRAPVVAAMYRTFKAAADRPEAIDEVARFWSLVRDMDHPDVRHPTRVLNIYLMQNINRPVAKNSAQKVRWSSRAIFVKCIHAWNAYVDGIATELRYVDSAPIPPVKAPRPTAAVSVPESEREPALAATA